MVIISVEMAGDNAERINKYRHRDYVLGSWDCAAVGWRRCQYATKIIIIKKISRENKNFD